MLQPRVLFPDSILCIIMVRLKFRLNLDHNNNLDRNHVSLLVEFESNLQWSRIMRKVPAIQALGTYRIPSIRQVPQINRSLE